MARDIFEDLRRQLGAEPEAEAPPLFAFVVDDEKGIRRLVSYALRELGAESEEYLSVLGMAAGLAQRHPDLIFLDISLDNADAIDAFRFLEQQEFRGAVQLMSGRDAVTMEKVKRAGEQRGLRMLPILQKPFRADAVRNVLHRLKHDAPALALGAQLPPRVPRRNRTHGRSTSMKRFGATGSSSGTSPRSTLGKRRSLAPKG